MSQFEMKRQNKNRLVNSGQVYASPGMYVLRVPNFKLKTVS